MELLEYVAVLSNIGFQHQQSMKTRPSFLLLCIAVVVLTVLIVWFARRPAKTSVPVAAPSQPVETVATTPAPPATNIHDSATGHVAVPTPSNAVSVPRKSKEQETLEILSTKNDIPIVFYGRVEDQFGNPVESAAINFNVRVMNGQESTVNRGQVMTDGNGFFTITGYRGQDLGVMPEKAGYTLASTSTLFKYSHLEDRPYVPNQNNPTVIKMWKLQGAEPLIHFSFKARIPHDDTSVVFDLHTGKIVDAGGDLIIRLKCPLEPSSNQQYDWQATIQPVDGGIVSSDVRLESRLGAPDSGYDSEFDINYQKDVKPWSSTFHGGFYFKDHGGSDYGEFDVGIIIYAIKDGFVPITLDGYINPAGSRNLEIDPKLVTEAHP